MSLSFGVEHSKISQDDFGGERQFINETLCAHWYEGIWIKKMKIRINVLTGDITYIVYRHTGYFDDDYELKYCADFLSAMIAYNLI